VAEQEHKALEVDIEGGAGTGVQWWTEAAALDDWLQPESIEDLEGHGELYEQRNELASELLETRTRIDRIKESHDLLKQFTASELRNLVNLKRNTSLKAWSLREDLVVLTFPMSNKDLAQWLPDRNREAVKKRLQLLKTKGLQKRPLEYETTQ
jgi:hypothetical protein